MNLLEFHPEMVLRVITALLLGALLGYERERTGKPAGVRTHGMVCIGAALFTVISIYGFGVSTDTSRVAAQIVTGIGFIGAGAILRNQGNVQGLTTAASLWVTAAIGLAVGTGMIALAVITTLLVFLLLRYGPRPGPKTTDEHSE
ncbi:MAG: MgtC/SapB family protein [bacterium]